MCIKICECLVAPLTYIGDTSAAYVHDTSTSRKITDLVISIFVGIAVTALVFAISAPAGAGVAGVVVLMNAWIIATGTSLTFMFLMAIAGGHIALRHRS